MKEWFRVTKTLPFGRKVLIFVLFIALISVFIWWLLAIYRYFTVVGPAKGGQYVEAVTGQPHFINPLLAPGSSASSDRLLTKLLFSGLYSYDQNGALGPDIAAGFVRSEDGKQYTVTLRKDIFWHDGENFTADDVVFTVNTAKDITYDTVVNALRVAWRDISVEKKDDYTLVFNLEKPRGDFLHLLTLGILPEHVWSKVSPVQFQLAQFNVKPVGSGPYVYVGHDLDAEGLVNSYTLSAYENYHRGEPRISRVVFQVFPDRVQAVEAYGDGLVSGVTADTPSLVSELLKYDSSEVILRRPSYFGVFFNQTHNVSLGYDEVRQALLYATDRKEIVDEIFGVSAFAVKSPLFEGMKDYVESSAQPDFDLYAAQKKLEENGWKLSNDGIRVLEGDADKPRLEFTIAVNADQEQIRKVAEILAQQWRKIGADVTVDAREKAELDANVISRRVYDALLTFHPMRWDQPNIFALWHSREKDHPGLNFSLLQDVPVDKALDDLQEISDPELRSSLYAQIQGRLKLEDPAVFLFAPGFLFSYRSDVKGVDLKRVNAPQDRFSNIHEWYIKERRQLKK